MSHSFEVPIFAPARPSATAHHLGLEGIIAPSAAGPGVALAVLFDVLRPESQVQVVSSQTWDAPPPRRP